LDLISTFYKAKIILITWRNGLKKFLGFFFIGCFKSIKIIFGSQFEFGYSFTLFNEQHYIHLNTFFERGCFRSFFVFIFFDGL
jgi:hypothetical protein